jgi:arylsulfatase A-like enzyme
MNGWNKHRVVPPGWNTFRAIIPDNGGDGDYYNYKLVGTGPDAHYDDDVNDYSTDVIRDAAEAFITTTPASQPLFLYFSPYGAHGSFIPAPRHEDTWPLEDLPPSVNSDNSGRVPFMQALPLVDAAAAKEVIRKQHEVVMSIDDAVGGIVAALGDRAENTLFLFTGDNGLQRGDHRLNGKNVPYQSSLNVQMIMRWDGQVTQGTRELEPVTNEDLAATIVDAADTTLPGSEGQSLLGPITRPGVYIEGAAQDGVPAWIGWRTRRHLYINWGTGQGEELYDYDNDRWELTNLAPNASNTLTLRNRTLQAGHPYPPGFQPY